jgi:5,10-methylenetetrahydromethanopterin reductase
VVILDLDLKSMVKELQNRVAVGFNADVAVPEMMQHVIMSENLGLDSVWFHEHSFGRDAISYLSACAQNTKRIKLGVACLNPYTRHPIVLAMSMLTLQEASKRRVILGLGTGFPLRLDALGISHEKPIGVLRETIEICRSIWKGENLTREGRFFSLTKVKSMAASPNPMIPIFIAGWRTQMLALTGAIADGYMAKGGESPQSLSRIISKIRESAEKHGRNIGDLEICAYLLTYVAENKSKALDVIRRDPFVNYMLSVQDDYLYEETGINPELKKPIAENYFKGRIEDSSRYITNEMLNAFTLCGTVDEIQDRIEEYKRSGLDLPVLQPISMKADDVKSVLSAAKDFAHPVIDEQVGLEAA